MSGCCLLSKFCMYVIIRDTFHTFPGSLGMLLEGKGKIPTRAMTLEEQNGGYLLNPRNSPPLHTLCGKEEAVIYRDLLPFQHFVENSWQVKSQLLQFDSQSQMIIFISLCCIPGGYSL